jgi:hypothetical protein
MLADLLEERKEVLKNKIMVNGFMVITNEARKRLTEIDMQIGRIKMDQERLLREIEDRFAGVNEAVVENIKVEIENVIGKRLDSMEKYFENIVELLEILVESRG